jgi:hypothetical protein
MKGIAPQASPPAGDPVTNPIINVLEANGAIYHAG